MQSGLGKALAIFLAALAMLSPAAGAAAADSGWVGANQLTGISRTARSTGQIPVLFECRNTSSNRAVLKPEIRVVTQPNGDKRAWSFFATNEDFKPGRPDEWGNWKKVDGNVLAVSGGSGTKLYCSLFHHRQSGTATNQSPPISIKTRTGWRMLN